MRPLSHLVKSDGDYADAASVADLKGVTCTSQQNTIWYDSCLPQIEDANILPAQESAPGYAGWLWNPANVMPL